MENLKRRNWMRTALTAVSALLLSMVVLNYAQSEQLTDARIRISAVYQKAFYETCELMEGISSNYRKLLVAGDDAQRQTLLGEISRQTQGAASNLALLPLGEDVISATIKFINQAEDFAETLSEKIAVGTPATAEDRTAMEALSDSAAAFTVEMEKLLERFENGELRFDAADFEETGVESLYPLTNAAGEYPVLLYDGPFSDGSEAGEFWTIKDAAQVSMAEAEQKLRAFIPVERLVSTGESHLEMDCYEFRVQSGGYNISAGVTKRGGEILYLLPEDAVEDAELTERQLCDIARAFLISRGYGAMEMSYASRFGGILTINYAATQDDVTLYPDLVKVQLSMRDGCVIGLDAQNYLRNHRERALASPSISAQEAMRQVGTRLTPSSARLCVIPQNRREYLCYEVRAWDENGDFLVYVDAETGVERELMQVISTNNGTLVM